MGEGTISELGGREKLHLEMLWGQCECDAGETYQLEVVTPWVRIPLAGAQPGVCPQVSPASCEERTKSIWVSVTNLEEGELHVPAEPAPSLSEFRDLGIHSPPSPQ